MPSKKLVVLDGNSLVNRAFFALPPMINSKGQPTGAIYGFTTMLFKILEDLKPDYIAAAFDRKAPTFRHLEYDEYKAGRKKMPEELFLQLEPLKKLLAAFHIGLFEMDGYEADDIIGTLSKVYQSEELHVTIYTGDKDALQLVSEHTTVMITRKGITETDAYDPAFLNEKYGLEPNGIIELKGLMGDSSDNLPGVPGVGEKTALKLLQEYKSIDAVYENLDQINGKKLKENLIQYKEMAYMSRRLATILTEVPIQSNLENMDVLLYNYEEIATLFSEFEFKSLINRLKPNEQQGMEAREIEDTQPYCKDQDMIQRIKRKKQLNYLLMIRDKELKGMLVEGRILVGLENLDDFKEIFEDAEIEKNTFDAKNTYLYLTSRGFTIHNLAFDALIAGYVLNPSESSYELRDLLHRYAREALLLPETIDAVKLGAEFIEHFDCIKKNMLDKITEYQMEPLFNQVEMPLIEVLAAMEIQGFKVNRDTLSDMGFELSEEIDRLTEKIYASAGEEFNINSPKQLGVILFEKLELPVIKKTKTGYSTDVDVLEELSSQHEIVEYILHYRQLVKLKSTYIDGLLSASNRDGRIHSSFKQTIAATGRISSTEPNMQNIPVKLEQGKRIRKAFIPESKEYVILSADYSQIELRLLAHISEDPAMVDAFVHSMDIHTRTASQVFGIPESDVTSLQRSRAKAVNFGIVYGLSDFGLSRDIKIPRKEAKMYIDNYFGTYGGVKRYLDEAIELGRKNGYVTTLMNRIRFIPEINSSNRNIKMFGERLAMNTPIQGTAADIIKIAMVRVYCRLKEEGLRSSLILQVHDELVLHAHREELSYVTELVRVEMEGALKLCVPLTVDIHVGEDWYDAK